MARSPRYQAELGDPTGAEAFVQPSGVAVGPHGGLYVLDGGSQMARVRMISPHGKVETLVTVDARARKLSAHDHR